MISETPGFAVYNADKLAIPLLLSVPHAGREYPDNIFDNLRLLPENLLRLEDRYADLLAREAIASGVPTIIASRARAWIDLNRDESDIDVAMVDGIDSAAHSLPRSLPPPSAKQRGGLGLIPRRLSGAGEIWKKPITVQELDHRIISHHRPYHAQIEQKLRSMRDQFGCALLLDLHSMPPIGPISAKMAPRFVVGDLFGRSAATPFSDLAASYLRAQGFVAALNYPYSGDYILRRHGDPNRNIHAIQIEVDRSLYLDATLREPAAAASKIARIVAELIQLLVDAAARHDMLIAAE